MDFRRQTLTQLAALCAPLAFSLACGSADNLQAVTMSDDAMGTGGAGEGGATTTGIVASQTTSTAAGFGGSFATNSSTGVGQGGGGGAACGEFELGITKTKSRLLVLFDRSCSMNTTLTKLNDASKWDIAVDAFAQLATLPAMPQLALSYFPAVNKCGEQLDVPFGPGSNIAVANSLKKVEKPGNVCCTPMLRAMQVAQNTQPPASGTVGSVVMVTDGSQVGCSGCKPDGNGFKQAVNIATDLRTKHGIRTFAVGFGGKESPGNLNDLATAGGTAKQPDPNGRVYYVASNQLELETAFANIAHAALSCKIKLSGLSPMPQPADLIVTLGGESVAHDANRQEGWAYSSEDTIELYGSACEDFKTGSELHAVVECPPDEHRVPR